MSTVRARQYQPSALGHRIRDGHPLSEKAVPRAESPFPVSSGGFSAWGMGASAWLWWNGVIEWPRVGCTRGLMVAVLVRTGNQVVGRTTGGVYSGRGAQGRGLPRAPRGLFRHATAI